MERQLIIVGLGNPGEKYRYTRHNIGHLFIEYLWNVYKLKGTRGKGPFYFASRNICSAKIFLVKTDTFMNISDEAVVPLLKQCQGQISDLVIVCDDFQLPFGSIRLRKRGSDGGQKGLRAILHRFNTLEITRLRLGIGQTEPFDPVEFVLSPFSKGELDKLPLIFEEGKKCIETLICESLEKAMSLFNKNVLVS